MTNLEADQISVLSMVVPTAPPPAAPIDFRRRRSRGSRRLLQQAPTLTVALRCMVPDLTTGDDVISSVGIGIASEDAQQTLNSLGVPVTDIYMPDFLTQDPWVNMTVITIIGPDVTGGSAVGALSSGSAAVAELTAAVSSGALARELSKRAVLVAPLLTVLLAPPALELLVGYAPPPAPPRVALPLPPAPPAPLMPTALLNPPPGAPPPLPAAPYVAPVHLLLGQPYALALGAIAGGVSGGAICIAAMGFAWCGVCAGLVLVSVCSRARVGVLPVRNACVWVCSRNAVCCYCAIACSVWRRRRIERLDKYRRTKYMMPTLMDMGVDITPESMRSGGKHSRSSGTRHSASRKSSSHAPSAAPSAPPRNWTELAQHLQRTRTPGGGSDGSRGRSQSSSRRGRSRSRDDGSWDSVRSYGTRRSRSQLPRVDEREPSSDHSAEGWRSSRSPSPPPPLQQLPPVPGEGMAHAADRLLNSLHAALGVSAVAPYQAQRRPRYPPGAPAPPGWGGSGESRGRSGSGESRGRSGSGGGSGSGSRSRSRGGSSRSARTGSAR
jgi:hypothetical protein